MSKETIDAIALTMLQPQLSPLNLMQMYRAAGSAAAIVEAKDNIRTLIPDATPRMTEILLDLDNAILRAQEEVEFCSKHSIKIMTPSDAEYPQRLHECEDAPLVLYFCGNGNLNSAHVIDIIGTRKITTYGQDIIRHFIEDLHDICPDALVVSGLAYGVDVNAHREALQNGMDTIGVVAHGLDTIYPATHREIAKEMTMHGGLLTEYPHNTRIDKRNFVQRNRIVAGMSDACILVESASKGGGLITAHISNDYNRDVFAFPGPVNAPYSAGCNNLIREDGAHLITSANDFVKFMGWEDSNILNEARRKGIERTLFPELTEEERLLVDTISDVDLQLNQITVKSGLPISKVSALLFTLEMKGLVRCMAGGTYHLLK